MTFPKNRANHLLQGVGQEVRAVEEALRRAKASPKLSLRTAGRAHCLIPLCIERHLKNLCSGTRFIYAPRLKPDLKKVNYMDVLLQMLLTST